MISVDTARDHLFSLVKLVPAEPVPLREAAGRVLADPVVAKRDQPPFAASAMDGYAINGVEADLHAQFQVIGEAAAGHGFDGNVGPGQTVRIFTGAPLPAGTDFVIIQEDVERTGALIYVTNAPGPQSNVRPAGGDFRVGSALPAPRLLRSADVALLASMNQPVVSVRRKPTIALISTGDELVLPGETPGPDQIIASNTFGLAAMLEDLGCRVRILPIARDTASSLTTAFELAEGADMIVTIGGASVGDHDLVGDVAETLGMERAFYKVRMRPGKPLMAGRMGQAAMVGLPGNPVSALVCGHVFVAPMVRKMLGLPDVLPEIRTASLAAAIGANGPREHYMRAVLNDGELTVFDRQDSSLLTVLADANALVIREPNDPAQDAGTAVKYIAI